MGEMSADECAGVADFASYGEPLGGVSGDPTAPSGPIVDLRRLDDLDELFAGRDDLASLIEEFATDSALCVHELRSLLDAGDVEGAALACHTLTGSAAIVGADRPAAHARRMQKRLAEASAEVADAGLDELEDALAEAVRVLRVAVGPDGARREPRR